MIKTILMGLTGWIISPFCWGQWIDITTFHYAGGYLLQGRKNRISNAKQFRVTPFKQWYRYPQTPNIQLETLKSVGL